MKITDPKKQTKIKRGTVVSEERRKATSERIKEYGRKRKETSTKK